MKPGDMLIYRGDEVEHWREPLMGNNHAQAFLHYNEKEGKYNIPYDGRPLLGMPGSFRSQESQLSQEQGISDVEESVVEASKLDKIIY